MSAESATLPGRLVERATQTPRKVALRRKALGVWQEWTWSAYLTRAARMGLGLAGIGVGAGDAVVVVGDGSPELLACEMGALGVGAAVAVGDPGAPSDELLRLVTAVRPAAVVVGDQEQLDKLVCLNGPVKPPLVVADPRGVTDEAVTLLADLEAGEAAVDGWVDRARRLAPDELAVVDGGGEGISHGKLLAEGIAFADGLGGTADDDLLSLLPPSVPAERAASLAAAVAAGWTVNFGEGMSSLAVDMRELQPTVVVGVAPLWEAMAAEARSRLAGARGLKGLAVRWGLGGEQGPVREVVVVRPLRAKLGLARARVLLCVDRPIGADAAGFFAMIGVPVRRLGLLGEVLGE